MPNLIATETLDEIEEYRTGKVEPKQCLGKYECIEDLPCDEYVLCNDGEIHKYNKATVKQGTYFSLIRKPIPTKKMYKLASTNSKFPITIYARKSVFQKYFKEVDE